MKADEHVAQVDDCLRRYLDRLAVEQARVDRVLDREAFAVNKKDDLPAKYAGIPSRWWAKERG
jgi:hypothetical protein